MSLVNQFDFQVWMMPTRSPPGWTLWPRANGPQSPSRRASRRRHPHLEVQLVPPATRTSRSTSPRTSKIREHIYGKLSHAGLSDIHIRKDKQRITVDIYTARPGIVIGKSGSEVDALRRELHGMTGKSVQVNITEIKRPELDARLVAQSIADSSRTASRSAAP